jgi:hypothetical protein
LHTVELSAVHQVAPAADPKTRAGPLRVRPSPKLFPSSVTLVAPVPGALIRTMLLGIGALKDTARETDEDMGECEATTVPNIPTPLTTLQRSATADAHEVTSHAVPVLREVADAAPAKPVPNTVTLDAPVDAVFPPDTDFTTNGIA